MIKYILAPYVSAGFYESELDFGFGSILSNITDKSKQEIFIKLACFTKNPRTIEEIKLFLKEYMQSSTSDSILKEFFEKNYLIKHTTFDKKKRYSRNALFYSLSGGDSKFIQKTIESKHVVILGCGGIGNIVSLNLATCGIKHLTLIDNDTIELSNLTRQIMFTENDINKKKVDVLKNALTLRNSNVKIEAIDDIVDSYDKTSLIPPCDLIVVSGDTKNICNYLNKFCYQIKIPFINVGYIQDIACWGPFIIPGKTPCYDCFSSKNIASHENELINLVNIINDAYQAPSFGAINMLSSAMATLDIIKYLGDFGNIQSLNKRIGIWTDILKVENQDYITSQGCTICS